jgi:glycerol kinase
MNTGETPHHSRNRLLTTIAWRLGPHAPIVYALEGSVFIGGAVVQWLRDGLRIIHESVDVEQLAGSVPDSGGVCFVPAFSGLGAPHWDATARGAILGLTRGTTAAHIARAAIESIPLQVNDLLAAMTADAGATLPELRVDGGAAANDALLQFQADVLGIPVVRPRVLETTAWGAACMAGLAVGVWRSPDELVAHRTIDRRFEPRMAPAEVAQRVARWREAVERSKGWAQDDDAAPKDSR